MAETDHNADFVVVSLSILSILIVLSNLCVCLLVYFKKDLRTNTNWLMVSLAVSDILTGGVLLPVYLIKPSSTVTGYLVCMILLSGVANLCTVTYDRYVAIMKPLEYSYRAPKKLKIGLALSWVLPAIYSLLPLFWETDSTRIIHRAYMVCMMFFGIILPYIFITFAYVRMFKQVRRSLTMKKNLDSLRVHKNERKRLHSEAKVAKVFSIVASAFLLCWLPIVYITTADIIFNRPNIIPYALSIISFFTIATSSLVNPLMYAFLKPDFKKAIRTCLRECTRKEAASTIRNLPLAALTIGGPERIYEAKLPNNNSAKTEELLSKENNDSQERSFQSSVHC